uniref:3-beta hydroxysteroid dehydrogenase n=1 Tax=Fundulus heteroclitus TaxID=8078 RepID=A0A1C9ZW77_FUNHE|nr:3-beta hydroxysteroid dehydrogenase [Fundulus heteroclitus]
MSLEMSLEGDVCVVTGACGFLGRRLVRLLLEEEKVDEIRLLDRDVQLQVLQSLENCRGETILSVFEGDIRDVDFLRKALRGATTVFHIASLIDVTESVEYGEMYGVNVKGTQLLLEVCIQENVASFIYTSTVEVMGPNPRGEPIVNGTEDTVYNTTLKFSYSKTKKEAEQRTLQANGETLQNGGRLSTCALRPTYIYGDGCRFLLYHMGDGIRNKNTLFRMSLPEAHVNPVYVGNVVFAHLQAARSLKDPQKRDLVGGRFYFLSDDTPPMSYSDFNYVLMSPLGFSIQDKLLLPLSIFYVLCFLLEAICAILRPLVRIVPPVNRQLLTLLNTTFTFSYQKAKKDLGYAPRYSWEEARKRTTEWLASQLPAEREKILSS